ncbi:unnamed protein product, partial [Cylicocyclus nassatus]
KRRSRSEILRLRHATAYKLGILGRTFLFSSVLGKLSSASGLPQCKFDIRLRLME